MYAGAFRLKSLVIEVKLMGASSEAESLAFSDTSISVRDGGLVSHLARVDKTLSKPEVGSHFTSALDEGFQKLDDGDKSTKATRQPHICGSRSKRSNI